MSSTSNIAKGVPQGSILGPLLYLIYVNDIEFCFDECTCLLYADDTLILAIHKDLRHAEDMLLKDFYKFQLWAHDKELLINTSKTKLMHIASPHSVGKCDLKLVVHSSRCLHINNKNDTTHQCNCSGIVELVNKQKYLGIYIDSRFLWDYHIMEIGKKLNYFAGCFYYLQDLVPTKVLITIYHSLVESILSYGITIWGVASKSYTQKLNTTQRRIIKNLNRNLDTDKIFQEYNILNITSLFAFRYIVNNYFTHEQLRVVNHVHTTRAMVEGRYQVPKVNNKYGERQLNVLLPKILNQLPRNMLELKSINDVKRNVRVWLLQSGYHKI